MKKIINTTLDVKAKAKDTIILKKKKKNCYSEKTQNIYTSNKKTSF
jgi:hypothetical protein